MDFLKRTWAEIHLERLGINIANYCACLQGETKLLCVVKASCYGHADLAICPYLEKELGIKLDIKDMSDIVTVGDALKIIKQACQTSAGKNEA